MSEFTNDTKKYANDYEYAMYTTNTRTCNIRFYRYPLKSSCRPYQFSVLSCFHTVLVSIFASNIVTSEDSRAFCITVQAFYLAECVISFSVLRLASLPSLYHIIVLNVPAFLCYFPYVFLWFVFLNYSLCAFHITSITAGTCRLRSAALNDRRRCVGVSARKATAADSITSLE